jgi:REP element-mobilizing transposase RayT
MISTTPLENECFYHIYNRGNNKELIFKEHDNYIYFLKLLARYILPFADVYAYNLLNNHFHLLVKIKDLENIKAEQGFSNLFNAYAKAFNKKYNRTGKLFEERFKRKKISDNYYLMEIIYYIHLNAQKHKLISDFRNYQYSFYNSILSLQKTRIQREEVLEWFGGREHFIKYHLDRKEELSAINNLEDLL